MNELMRVNIGNTEQEDFNKIIIEKGFNKTDFSIEAYYISDGEDFDNEGGAVKITNTKSNWSKTYPWNKPWLCQFSDDFDKI
ncbi:hypothetical protein [Vibrio pectenicida]|uniref:Uncharacterized protein n=1 Tax=Vibrio pectenicida TaxID=62763 RepID=A0A427TVZ3_9VIBR|nr:hypothetical protein [Vibrio pectenicida]RSD28572.1 hypothetical protein EJA03_18950 [Vibrio pectenicida]